MPIASTIERASEGKLGYVHIPDMGGQGLVMFSRLFYPQYTKQGLVIDIRDNGGGFVSQMIIQRPRERCGHSWSRARYCAAATTHRARPHGCDHRPARRQRWRHFPASFRMLGLGPLIGTPGAAS